MKKIKKYISKNKIFLFFIFIILAIAFILRFYDYPSRFIMGPDQAGFAIQSKYALESFKLPMLGPFSSGAPFQTGGEWYWFVMLGYLIFPFTHFSPWIFLTISSLIFIVLLIFYSKNLVNEKFALLVGFLAAISTAQITQSLNLSNQSPQAIFSLLTLYFSYYLLKTKKEIYSFFMGLSIGIASAIHLQGGALLSIFIFTALVGRIKSFKVYLAFVFGAFLAWFPVLLKDIENSFYNTTNMYKYYLFNENVISYEALGRRWLTFSTEFIPQSWAYVSGGHYFVSFIVIFLSILLFLYLLYKRKLDKNWIVIFCAFLVSVIILRYTRTPIFDSYFVFLHPFVYLITGFVIYNLFKIKKVLGIAILLVIILFSINKSIDEISTVKSNKDIYINFSNELIEAYPNDKFNIYDYKFKNKLIVIPIVHILYSKDKISDEGLPIGINIATSSAEFNSKFKPVLDSSPKGLEFYDLNEYSEKEIEDLDWVGINPSDLYNATQNWYK